MECDTYSIYWREICLARGMSLEHAILFVEAMFTKWYNETDSEYTIKREKKNEEAEG